MTGSVLPGGQKESMANAEPGPCSLSLIILINDLVVADILDDRVQLDFEPRLEHRVVTIFGPGRLVRVPPIQFVLENCRIHLFENIPRLVVVVITRDQIDSLLIVRIGHDPRVIQFRRPIQIRLLRPYDDDATVEHRSTPRYRGRRANWFLVTPEDSRGGRAVKAGVSAS